MPPFRVALPASAMPMIRPLAAVALLAFTACAGGARGGGGGSTSPTTASYDGRGSTAEAAGDYGGASASVSPPAEERPGLGTVWGEQVYSPVTSVPFERASSSPWAAVALHYNDASGVAAHAGYLGAPPAPLEVLAGDGSLAVAVVDASGATLPGFSTGGRTFVIGRDGEAYKLVIRNATTARFEIVAAVDGLDVIDGKPANTTRRGYIVEPHGVLVIDGFRQSDREVAAFRFGRVADSYAARTSGDRNVGVIGVAIFAERGAVWTPAELHRRDTADPFPGDRGYARPPN